MRRFVLPGIALACLTLLLPSEAAAQQSHSRTESWTVAVPANGEKEYKITFNGDKQVSFWVVGDGDTDLDLFVYDSSGRSIGSDVALNDVCVVHWVPTHPQEFRIVVRNLGSPYNNAKMGWAQLK